MFQAIVDLIKDIWHALVPFVIIDEYERGVRLRFGKILPVAHPPGLHWRWWLIERVEAEPVNERTIDLPTVYITTTDQQTFALSANLYVQTFDPVLMWKRVDDHENSMSRAAAGELAEWAKTMDSFELSAVGAPELKKCLCKKIDTRTKRWGVATMEVQLTTCAPIDLRGHLVEGSLL